MSIIIFIIILGVLIFVHELGHFLVAKKSGIRVDEFAIGFPPRLWSTVKGGTRYALNLIPFGGYVKIFGENPDEASLDPQANDSFVNKSRMTQAAVLIAGIVFNILFAWLLLSISLMSGFPSVVSEENERAVTDPQVVVTYIEEDSPADIGKLEVGDVLKTLSVSNGDSTETISVTSAGDVQSFIASHPDDQIAISFTRKGEAMEKILEPVAGIVGEKEAIGIAMDLVGTVRYGFFEALYEGYTMTGTLIKEVAVGLYTLITRAISGTASLSDVSGPVGIVGLVDSASNFGFFYLLGFTAFISVNLAVLNILPFPALDGGRLLFVLIESIIRRPIPVKVANWLNGIGFLILLLFMVIVTVSDVLKLF